MSGGLNPGRFKRCDTCMLRLPLTDEGRCYRCVTGWDEYMIYHEQSEEQLEREIDLCCSAIAQAENPRYLSQDRIETYNKILKNVRQVLAKRFTDAIM